MKIIHVHQESREMVGESPERIDKNKLYFKTKLKSSKKTLFTRTRFES